VIACAVLKSRAAVPVIPARLHARRIASGDSRTVRSRRGNCSDALLPARVRANVGTPATRSPMNPQETFVTRLRRHRERNRISLDEIAAASRVKKELFEALEANDLSAWPRASTRGLGAHLRLRRRAGSHRHGGRVLPAVPARRPPRATPRCRTSPPSWPRSASSRTSFRTRAPPVGAAGQAGRGPAAPPGRHASSTPPRARPSGVGFAAPRARAGDKPT
jgi:hypothetical protein